MTDETTPDTFRYFSHFQCLGSILREENSPLVQKLLIFL